MSNTIKGAITFIGQLERVNDKLEKRTFRIKTDGQYPKEVQFTLLNKNVDKTDRFQINEVVEVSFDVSSREYNGKWYDQITAYKIEKQPYNLSNYNNDVDFDPWPYD